MKSVIPRLYLRDVELVWTLGWVISHHPVPHQLGKIAHHFCPFRVASSLKKRLDAGRR